MKIQRGLPNEPLSKSESEHDGGLPDSSLTILDYHTHSQEPIVGL